MKRKDRKNKGFTLVELVVVMVIIGILATIAVPMYSGYVQRSRAQEGVALAGSVASAQKVWYAEHREFRPVGLTYFDRMLGVDGRGNTHFQEYEVTTSGVGDDAAFHVVIGGTSPQTDGMRVEARGGATRNTVVGVWDVDNTQISGPDPFQ